MYNVIAFLSVFSAFFESDFLGKIIFISLFILSIVSWVVMVDKIKTFKATKRNCLFFDRSFEKEKTNLLHFNLKIFSKTFNPYLSIYLSVKQKTLEILGKNKYFADILGKKDVYLSPVDIELVESQVGAVIAHEAKKLENNLFILSTVITLAPFLGLLGTVWGILNTFSGLSGGISGANSAILSGLSMALGTTVFGLVVAIPPLIAYNYLKSQVRDLSCDMELFSHNLMTTLEIQYRMVDKYAQKTSI